MAEMDEVLSQSLTQTALLEDSSAKTTEIPPLKPGQLDSNLQIKLDQDKINLRIENESYLRRHPEIGNILSYFINQTLKERPEDLRLFATKLLSDKSLQEIVEQHVAKMQKSLPDPWATDAAVGTDSVIKYSQIPVSAASLLVLETRAHNVQ